MAAHTSKTTVILLTCTNDENHPLPQLYKEQKALQQIFQQVEKYNSYRVEFLHAAAGADIFRVSQTSQYPGDM